MFSFHEIVINFEMFQNDPKAVTSTHKIHLSILWRPNILLRQTMDTVNILNMGLLSVFPHEMVINWEMYENNPIAVSYVETRKKEGRLLTGLDSSCWNMIGVSRYLKILFVSTKKETFAAACHHKRLRNCGSQETRYL